MKIARKDVKACLNIWKEILLENFSDKIEVIYSKGSASKPWETAIDYVPILSDVDIHVRFANDDQNTPLNRLPMDRALELSKAYETRFLSSQEEYLHLPRVQINDLTRLSQDPSFLLPQVEDVVLLYGWYDPPVAISDEIIRGYDKKNLLRDTEFIKKLPVSAFDRTGLDYWSLLRRINWRISPAPVRLLTQLILITPCEIWSWNRTKIINELIKQDLNSLATSYQEYYIVGWKLFLSEFSKSEFYREIFKLGSSIFFKITRVLKSQGIA
jgi:hypothetical protein